MIVSLTSVLVGAGLLAVLISGGISDPDWRMIVGTPVLFPTANAGRQHAVRHVLQRLGGRAQRNDPLMIPIVFPLPSKNSSAPSIALRICTLFPYCENLFSRGRPVSRRDTWPVTSNGSAATAILIEASSRQFA